MTKILALRYRPIRFSEIVGQVGVRAVLRAMVKDQNVPPALIFGGTRGTGKTTAARILAAALNCEESTDYDACGECPSCVAVQQCTSTSVLEVDAASNGGVEEVRKIRDMCQYAHEGQWRLVLLDEAHSLSREAFNALLKLLEEPPANTTFILLTTETHKILDTVRSRAMHFEFKRITEIDIRKRLRSIANEESIEVSDDLLTEIARRSQGGMRDALMMLDQISRVGIFSIEAFHEMFGYVDIALPLLKAATDQDFSTGVRLIEESFSRVGDAAAMTSDLMLAARDIIAVKAGADLFEFSPPQLAARKELASRVPSDRLSAAIRVLWDLRAKTRHTEDDQLAVMHMAFVLLADALRTRLPEPAPSAPSPAPEAAPAVSRLSLAEMRVLAGQRKT